jgi:hypothetical protein
LFASMVPSALGAEICTNRANYTGLLSQRRYNRQPVLQVHCVKKRTSGAKALTGPIGAARLKRRLRPLWKTVCVSHFPFLRLRPSMDC